MNHRSVLENSTFSNASLGEFDSDITRVLKNIGFELERQKNIEDAKLDINLQNKFKNDIANAYTKLLSSLQAPCKVVFNAASSSFAIENLDRDHKEQIARLEKRIKLFKDVVEIYSQFKAPHDREDEFFYKRMFEKLIIDDLDPRSAWGERDKRHMIDRIKDVFSLSQAGYTVDYVEQTFSTVALEKELEELKKLQTTIPEDFKSKLEDEFKGLNKLADDTIKDFPDKADKKSQDLYLKNRKIGFVCTALAVVAFATAAIVLACVAPPAAFGLVAMFAVFSAASFPVGITGTLLIGKEAAKLDSIGNLAKEDSQSFIKIAKNVTDKYLMSVDNSKPADRSIS